MYVLYSFNLTKHVLDYSSTSMCIPSHYLQRFHEYKQNQIFRCLHSHTFLNISHAKNIHIQQHICLSSQRNIIIVRKGVKELFCFPTSSTQPESFSVTKLFARSHCIYISWLNQGHLNTFSFVSSSCQFYLSFLFKYYNYDLLFKVS